MQKRASYYKGRKNIPSYRQRHRNKIIYVDINSLYPYVMSKNLYPNVNKIFKCKPGNIEYEGVSDAEIEYFEHDYVPLLPVRCGGKLLFPVGRFRGWYSNFELRYGISKGIFKIIKVYESIDFRETTDLFSGVIDYLYTMRRKYAGKKDTESEFYNITLKLLMNSLYGKFGEEVESKDLFFENDEIVEIVVKENYFPVHTNYILSLYTTAFARVVLYEGLIAVNKAGGRLLYCDTDSIIYIGRPDILKISSELGEYKIEGKFASAEFFQPKNYVLYDSKGNPKIACKGISKDKAYDYILNASATYKRPVRLRESFRAKNKKPNVWEYKTKNLKSFYDKRKIILDNCETRAYTYEEINSKIKKDESFKRSLKATTKKAVK